MLLASRRTKQGSISVGWVVPLFITCLFAPTASAQFFGVGVKAGLNSATISGVRGAESILDIHLGVAVPYELSDRIHLQPEILFSRQGTKVETDLFLRYNYLNAPILVKAAVWKKLYLEAGPQFGYRQAANIEEDGEAASVRNQITALDFAVVGGISFYVPDYPVFLGIRYNRSLNNTLITPPANLLFTNRVFQFYIGYLFE